jgi:hypothetical protein
MPSISRRRLIRNLAMLSAESRIGPTLSSTAYGPPSKRQNARSSPSRLGSRQPHNSAATGLLVEERCRHAYELRSLPTAGFNRNFIIVSTANTY